MAEYPEFLFHTQTINILNGVNIRESEPCHIKTGHKIFCYCYTKWSAPVLGALGALGAPGALNLTHEHPPCIQKGLK